MYKCNNYYPVCALMLPDNTVIMESTKQTGFYVKLRLCLFTSVLLLGAAV